MSIRTREFLSGFVATDPEMTFTIKGDARVFNGRGSEHKRVPGPGQAPARRNRRIRSIPDAISTRGRMLPQTPPKTTTETTKPR